MPVDLRAQLLPPYSAKLDDYISGFSDKLSVVLVNRDVTYPNMQVRLRMTIKSQMFELRTKDYNYYPPIILDPHAQLRLTHEDLAPYFNPNNYNHNGGRQFNNDHVLPSGMVEFVFEVLDYRNGNRLSNVVTCMAYIAVQKPATLYLPENGKSIQDRVPLNEQFTWHIMPSGATNIEYELIIKQLFGTSHPENQWAYSPIVFREVISPQNSYNYGAFSPLLMPGYRYAWAVQAKVREGTEQLNVLENSGLSEIRWFYLAEDCPLPSNVRADAPFGHLHLSWDGSMQNETYIVEYRMKAIVGEPVNYWMKEETAEPDIVLRRNTQEGDVVEYRIGAKCQTGTPFYGVQIGEFTIPRSDTIVDTNCGKEPPPVDLSNQDPLPELKLGDVFYAGGGAPVHVLSISGSNGVFSGEGYSFLPKMFGSAKIAVRWNSIRINTDYVMIEGRVKGIYDTKKALDGNLDKVFEGGADVGKVATGLTYANVDVNFVIPDGSVFVFDPGANLITITNNGNSIGTIDLSSLSVNNSAELNNDGGSIFPITVKDADGNIYQVDMPDNGTTSDTDTVGAGLALPSIPTQLVVTKIGQEDQNVKYADFAAKSTEATVTFSKGDGYYAFDEYNAAYEKSLLIRNKYEKFGDNYVPYKLIPTGKSDVVSAKLTQQKNIRDFEPKNVLFATPKGTVFTNTYNASDSTYAINLSSGEAGDGMEVFALYKIGSNKYLNFGKLVVYSYLEHTHKVVLVSVNGAAIDKSAIEEKINEVYNPVGEAWSVEVDGDFEYAGSANFFAGNSGLLSTYTQEMKDLQTAYSEWLTSNNKTLDNTSTYLFFFDRETADRGNRNINGFMPRDKQFGYIFTQGFSNETILSIAVAHELGHGYFSLKHPFDNDYGLMQNQLNENLMDYGNGTHLAKWQWDIIKDPGLVNRLFEKDGDAMLAGDVLDKYNYSPYRFLCKFFDDEPRHDIVHSNKKVAIDPGHGDHNNDNKQIDPGAVSGMDYEKDLALKISLSVRDRLMERGVSTLMTRVSDTIVAGKQLAWRVTMAHKDSCDIFVSIHLNAIKNNPIPNGFSVYYKKNQEKSKQLAISIKNSQTTMLPKNNGLTTADFQVLRDFQGEAAVLVEVGFISNPQDLERIKDNYRKIGREIADGICNYLKK